MISDKYSDSIVLLAISLRKKVIKDEKKTCDDDDDGGTSNERLVKYKERLHQWVICVIAGLRFAQWAHTSELPDERLGVWNYRTKWKLSEYWAVISDHWAVSTQKLPV